MKFIGDVRHGDSVQTGLEQKLLRPFTGDPTDDFYLGKVLSVCRDKQALRRAFDEASTELAKRQLLPSDKVRGKPEQQESPTVIIKLNRKKRPSPERQRSIDAPSQAAHDGMREEDSRTALFKKLISSKKRDDDEELPVFDEPQLASQADIAQVLAEVESSLDLPIGTPALIRKAGSDDLHVPGRITSGNHRAGYNCTLFDGKRLKKVNRLDICVPTDAQFGRTRIPDNLSSNGSTKRNRPVLPLLTEFAPLLQRLLSGQTSTRRRVEFMKGHQQRVQLQHEVRPGPLTFSEYYELIDALVADWLPTQSAAFGALALEAGVSSSRSWSEKEATRVLARQFAHIVLLPELLIAILCRYGPDLSQASPVKKPARSKVSLTTEPKMSYEEADGWLLEGRTSGDIDDADYVEYLLSKREMYRWAAGLRDGH